MAILDLFWRESALSFRSSPLRGKSSRYAVSYFHLSNAWHKMQIEH